ncbi:MAG: hypothetical protein M5U15_04850 [Kiritimatiellae bacterium]|nr:hypothetical protein [Kiritimatiellia bacterium]
MRESSTERTHNARRYATLPGGGPDVVRPDIQARPRAAWRCVVGITDNVRRVHEPQLAAARYRAEAVSGHVFGDALCWSESASGSLARKMPPHFSCTGSGWKAERLASRVRKQAG